MLNYNGLALLSKCKNSVIVTIKSIDGTTKTINNNNYSTSVLFHNNMKMVLGDGNTTPTIDDYSIENEVNSLTLISFVCPNQTLNTTIGYGDINSILTATATYKNNTNSPIEIKEIALYGYYASQSYGDDKYYMILREVLETPVTIAPNTTKAFSVTIN